MYSELIKRKLGFIVAKSNNEKMKHRENRFAFFAEGKRKEIIVWMWLHGDKDKAQIQDIIKKQFNTSDHDTDRLFYEAFPDGLDLQEETALNTLDNVLIRAVNMNPAIITDTFDILTGNTPEISKEQYNMDPAIIDQIKLVIGSMLKSRNLI